MTFAGLGLPVWLALPLLAAGSETCSLRWNTNSNPVTVEVTGVGKETLRRLQESKWLPDDWQNLLSVHAGVISRSANPVLPPMLGNYRVAQDVIRFEPAYPWERGVAYRATFRPANLPGATDHHSAEIVSTFALPATPQSPSTVITHIYPSSDLLPSNLLKFYVCFSAPMRRGHIYDHIRLLDQTGNPVELPFLEIDEELWNPDMTRLTLFIDPGRIKRGVQPLEEIGPVLEPGRRYTLVIDRDWRDAEGNSLKAGYRKRFRAGPPAAAPLNAKDWKISAPAARSSAALRIRFPAPLDHALAHRMIHVTDANGHPVQGQTILTDTERQWRFVPSKVWTPGQYQIVVETAIEDLAGNNIGKPFEVDLFETARQTLNHTTVTLPFSVK